MRSGEPSCPRWMTSASEFEWIILSAVEAC